MLGNRGNMYILDFKVSATCGSELPEWERRSTKVGDGDTLQNQKRVSCVPS